MSQQTDPSKQQAQTLANVSDEDHAKQQAQNGNQAQQNDIDLDLYGQQLEYIRQEAKGDAAIIGDLIVIEALEEEFANNIPFLQKICILKEKYNQIRKVRRDGSCFYRSYIFLIFEHIVTFQNEDLQKKLLAIFQQSKEDLKKIGYEELVLEDFYDAIIENLNKLTKPDFTHDKLIELFRDNETSDSLVMYLRFMTSGYLKMNAILYENYIENGMTIDRYCATEVDPIDKEADQLSIMALMSYLTIPMKIVYLDSNINKIEPDIIVFPEDADQSKIFVNLLYRPGHYDIIYGS